MVCSGFRSVLWAVLGAFVRGVFRVRCILMALWMGMGWAGYESTPVNAAWYDMVECSAVQRECGRGGRRGC